MKIKNIYLTEAKIKIFFELELNNSCKKNRSIKITSGRV